MNFNPDPFGEDRESLEQSERDALEHEANAEMSRDAWCDAEINPGACRVIDVDGVDVHTLSLGDAHMVVERISHDPYEAFLVDTTDMSLVEFHFTVIEAVAKGNPPGSSRDLDDAEVDAYHDTYAAE